MGLLAGGLADTRLDIVIIGGAKYNVGSQPGIELESISYKLQAIVPPI
jgi:hypothetical protein